MLKSRKTVLIFMVILLLSIISIIFVYNDDFLYSKTIVKITKIEKEDEEVYTNTLNIKEPHYMQKITGIITNGKNKGKKVTIDYETTYSSVITDKYKVGDKVFIDSLEIDGLKRDTYLTFLVVLFILAIFLVGKYRGILAIISVIFNSSVFCIGLNLYHNYGNLILVCIIESIIFTIISLFIANGINKKTISAIISVFISMLMLTILIFIVTKLTNYKGLNFNELRFLTVPSTDVLLPELFIGGLGAIMDVSITISSAIGELIEKNPKIKNTVLKKSGKEIGKDIMSTMINVLFFTYLCSSLPTLVLAVRNGYSFFKYLNVNFSLELTRFLTGSIGIVMTIPIAIYIAIKFLKKGSVVNE